MEYVILFNRLPRDEECLAQVRCQTRHELNLSFGKNADGHKIVFFLKGNKGSIMSNETIFPLEFSCQL